MKVAVGLSSAAALAAVALGALPEAVTRLLDTDVHPCDDFYHYACGKWLQATAIPENRPGIDYADSPLVDMVRAVTMEIVRENWPLLGDLWESCMDTETVEAQGNGPLQPHLERILTTNSTTELLAVVGDMNRFMPAIFTDVIVQVDPRTGRRGPVIAPGEHILPNRPEYVERYRTYIRKITDLAGIETADDAAMADRIIDLEKQQATPARRRLEEDEEEDAEDAPLAHVHAHVVLHKHHEHRHHQQHGPSTKASDATRNTPTIDDIMNQLPLSVGAIVRGSRIFEISGYPTNSTAAVNKYEYFKVLEKVLADTPLEDLQVYVAFRLVHAHVFELSSDFIDAFHELMQSNRKIDREGLCLDRTSKLLPNLLDRHFVAKTFDKKREEYMNTMVDLVKEIMGQRIAKSDWLDATTKKEATQKLSKVVSLVGQSKAKRSYPFAFKRGEFFQNVVEARKFDDELTAHTLGTTVSPEEWWMPATTVNAWYTPTKNTITFPAAKLQPPHLSLINHPAQNYGGIGTTVGHELTHGFDTSGKNYDGDGFKRDWWTNASADAFESRAMCMRKQYSEFEVIGESGKRLGFVNGNLTIGENIADNGGLALAYYAYRAFMSSGKGENVGDLTEEEGDQLFFLAFAQKRCSKFHDETMRELMNDVHSPTEFRIKGSAMNSPEFARVFKCPLGSPMNPQNKCHLW